jgi:hypothetical protein
MYKRDRAETLAELRADGVSAAALRAALGFPGAPHEKGADPGESTP